MRNKSKNVRVDRFAFGLVLFAAPLVIGAKGCDTAVVGDDHHPEAGADTGMTGGDSGTGGSTATGGSPATGGTSGSTATGGSPATGGTSGSTATGGSPATGGTSGSTATGGTSGTGGKGGKGGSSATGGLPATGGASGSAGSGGTAGAAGGGGGTCGGLQGLACASDEYCDYAPEASCGAADQLGTCQTKPQGCTDIYAPVCGCNGMTYSSACDANAAGISVAAQGVCSPNTGGTCGGDTGVTCDATSFCKYAATVQCGRRGDTGTCTAIPDACDTLDQPVCGCDGMTHANECAADMAGTSVASTGACLGGDTCGGITGATCPSEQFCNFPVETQCGSGDQTGTCVLAGGSVCSDIVMEVCGCDGKTYPNACNAMRAQTSVASNGACPTQ